MKATQIARFIHIHMGYKTVAIGRLSHYQWWNSTAPQNKKTVCISSVLNMHHIHWQRTELTMNTVVIVVGRLLKFPLWVVGGHNCIHRAISQVNTSACHADIGCSNKIKYHDISKWLHGAKSHGSNPDAVSLGPFPTHCCSVIAFQSRMRYTAELPVGEV